MLRYENRKRQSPGTLRRHYIKWRRSHGLLEQRCDLEICIFYSQPLEWNGKPLKLILDHKNGNNSDDRHENLRFLCPNCNSQLEETQGGANRGRIEKAEGGFAVVKKGKRDHFLPIGSADFAISGRASKKRKAQPRIKGVASRERP